MTARLLAALCLLPALVVVAAEETVQATVSSRLLAPETALAGQRLTYEVEIVSNALSFQGLRVVPPAAEGGLLVSDAATTVKGTRRVAGESRQYVTHRFPLYPQRPGTVRVAPATVTFTASLGYGRPSRDFRLEADAQTLAVRALPDGLSLAAAGLTADAALEPPGGTVAVGDATTLLITRRLDDAPALLLEPLELPPLPGVSVYPGTAEVHTDSARGRLTGVRRDRFTLVFEVPGAVLLPAFRFPWWDLGAGEARVATVPALRFEVTGAEARGTGRDEERRGLVAAAGAAAALGTLAAFAYLARRRRAGDGPRQRLAALKRAARANDSRAAHAAFLRWQDAARPAADCAELDAALRALEEALVAGTSWEGGALRRALRLRSARQRRRPPALTALNPGS